LNVRCFCAVDSTNTATAALQTTEAAAASAAAVATPEFTFGTIDTKHGLETAAAIAESAGIGFGVDLQKPMCRAVCLSKALPDEVDLSVIPPGSVSRYSDAEHQLHDEIKWIGGLLPELTCTEMDYIVWPRHWRVCINSQFIYGSADWLTD
jgi:hypothetical protein